MMWHVELDPLSYFEDVWVLMCRDAWMLIGSSGDVPFMQMLCEKLNESLVICALQF